MCLTHVCPLVSFLGHFTQVVWKGSEELGVGLATDGKTTFVVGQYLPAGNISNPGYFEKNVLAAGSSVKVHAATGGTCQKEMPGLNRMMKEGEQKCVSTRFIQLYHFRKPTCLGGQSLI